MRSSRPIYVIILFSVGCIWLGILLFPLLYSTLFPNDDIRKVVLALEERGAPPAESQAAVQQAIAGVGALRWALQVAQYSGFTTTYHLDGGNAETIKVSEASYIAWFQKPSTPMLISISRYEGDGNRKAFAITQGNPVALVRGYAPPLFLFGVSLFLFLRKSTAL